MLSKLISKDFCSACRFCCVFKVCHLWETPLFSADNIPETGNCRFRKTETNNTECYSFVSENDYAKKPDEEIPCPFLNSDTGCILDDRTKPFECRIWPYRVMTKNGKTILAVSKECPAISQYSTDFLSSFAKQNILIEIKNFIEKHPYIIKEYRDNYSELFEF